MSRLFAHGSRSPPSIHSAACCTWPPCRWTRMCDRLSLLSRSAPVPSSSGPERLVLSSCFFCFLCCFVPLFFRQVRVGGLASPWISLCTLRGGAGSPNVQWALRHMFGAAEQGKLAFRVDGVAPVHISGYLKRECGPAASPGVFSVWSVGTGHSLWMQVCGGAREGRVRTIVWREGIRAMMQTQRMRHKAKQFSAMCICLVFEPTREHARSVLPPLRATLWSLSPLFAHRDV